MDREIEANPDKPELYEKRGDLYFELEGFDEAITDYKKVIAMDSSRVDAHLKLAQTYLEYDNSRLALLTLEAASYQFPDNIDILHDLGEFQIILKRNNDAFATLQRATKVDRFNPRSYYLMGVNFQDIDDEEKAIRSFKVAIDKDADFVPALMRLGFIFDAKEDPIALQYFDSAIAADPDFYSAYLAKGNTLGSQGKFEEAIKVFKQITSSSGEQQPSAFYNIGLAYLQLDSLEQSKKHFEITKQLDPTFGLAHYYLGEVTERMGDVPTAKSHYSQATSFDNTRDRASFRGIEVKF
jgi:tetratricopeptide (TPR) repeat protein